MIMPVEASDSHLIDINNSWINTLLGTVLGTFIGYLI